MASDFTVIQSVRQRFGDNTPGYVDFQQEQEAPFVGRSKAFPFSCPRVDPTEIAVLQFESLAVSTDVGQRSGRNILRVNDVNIPSGITPGDTNTWKAHHLLVPANVLRENNVLHIEAVRKRVTLDDFIIDNVVILYKIRPSGTGPGGVVVSPA